MGCGAVCLMRELPANARDTEQNTYEVCVPAYCCS